MHARTPLILSLAVLASACASDTRTYSGTVSGRSGVEPDVREVVLVPPPGGWGSEGEPPTTDMPPPPPPPPPPEPAAPPPDGSGGSDGVWDDIIGTPVGETAGGSGTLREQAGAGAGPLPPGGSDDGIDFSVECASRGDSDPARGEGYACVTLLYGTNREPVAGFGALDEQRAYGIRPDPWCEPGADAGYARYCRLGILTVTVPDTRRRGDPINSVPRNAVTVSDEDRSEGFSLWNYREITEDIFADYARAMLADALGAMNGEYDNQAIVFIHGFNVRFRDAAFRAAQIKYDLEFPGPVFFYSWPANGSVLHYLADMDDADLSSDAFLAFMQQVRSALPDAQINVIAHSMGTRVFAQALSRLTVLEPDFRLGHVFFASGDLDRNLFVEWAGPAAPRMDSLTLYTSSTDAAVASAELLRNLFPPRDPEERDSKVRIGFFRDDEEPPVFNFAVGEHGLTPHTIDMTDGEFSFFGFATRYLLGRADMRHSEYMERTPIIDDMGCILRHGVAVPETRHSGMIPQTSGAGLVYWRFDESGSPAEACAPLQ